MPHPRTEVRYFGHSKYEDRNSGSSQQGATHPLPRDLHHGPHAAGLCPVCRRGAGAGGHCRPPPARSPHPPDNYPNLFGGMRSTLFHLLSKKLAPFCFWVGGSGSISGYSPARPYNGELICFASVSASSWYVANPESFCRNLLPKLLWIV